MLRLWECLIDTLSAKNFFVNELNERFGMIGNALIRFNVINDEKWGVCLLGK